MKGRSTILGTAIFELPKDERRQREVERNRTLFPHQFLRAVFADDPEYIEAHISELHKLKGMLKRFDEDSCPVAALNEIEAALRARHELLVAIVDSIDKQIVISLEIGSLTSQSDEADAEKVSRWAGHVQELLYKKFKEVERERYSLHSVMNYWELACEYIADLRADARLDDDEVEREELRMISTMLRKVSALLEDVSAMTVFQYSFSKSPSTNPPHIHNLTLKNLFSPLNGDITQQHCEKTMG